MSRINLATNNGDIAGGEVMLLRVARAMRELGHHVIVIGPRTPGDLVAAAGDEGFETVILAADSRVAYLRELRRWGRGDRGLLWCNGLVPALASFGRSNRVVHLHQVPRGLQRLALRFARWRSLAVVVPSGFMCSQVSDSINLDNWTDQPAGASARSEHTATALRIGFLGRYSHDKGLDVLAGAVSLIESTHPGRVRLISAGDSRHVPKHQRALVNEAIRSAGSLVEDLGWVAREDLFDQVDVVAFPSVWPEPFGLVAAEAMASGVPLIVSDAGALPEVVGPDHPWVARADDVEDLAAVIVKALGVDRTRVTMAAHERWAQHYSPPAGRARLDRLLRQLGID